MKIKIGKVEGNTKRKGSKQGQVFTIKEEIYFNFYDAENEKGKKYTIWDLNGDWSKIGICEDSVFRYTYTTDFEIINK